MILNVICGGKTCITVIYIYKYFYCTVIFMGIIIMPHFFVYSLPLPKMTHTDVKRILNSKEVRAAAKPKRETRYG